MKAFLVSKPHDYGLADVELPRPGKDEVLVRVGACGICGSDIDIIEGTRPMEVTAYPVILGHEFSGEVVETGSEAKHLMPGDRVAVDTRVSCRRCPNCAKGWTNQCLAPFQQLGCTMPGGMAEYVAVPQNLLYKLPAEMDVADAALAEPAACAAYAVSKAQIRPGDFVVVTGVGSIGALALQFARLYSPAQLISIEVDPLKLTLASKLGATHVINARREKVTEAVKEITGGTGAHAIIECTGSLEPIQQAFYYVAPQGKIVAVGIPPQLKFEIDFLALLLKDADFRASAGYTTPIFQWSLQALCRGAIDTKTIISHRLPLSAALDAFAILKERKEPAVKVLTSARWESAS